MCTNFEDIIGATGTTFTPPAATSTMYYRVVAIGDLGVNCEEVSNCITISANTPTCLDSCEDADCGTFPANPTGN